VEDSKKWRRKNKYTSLIKQANLVEQSNEYLFAFRGHTTVIVNQDVNEE
jgi:hypothetical protein